jgi:hypothetical protein
MTVVESELGIDHEVALGGFRLIEQIGHPAHHHSAAVDLVDRTHLAAADMQHLAHQFLL